MQARYHVIVSAGLSVGLYASTHSLPASMLCLLSGVLIDLDHVLEYYIDQKKWPKNYKELTDFCNDYQGEKAYLVFHAYEYLITLWAIIGFFQLNVLWVGFALGITVHVLCDQFTNPIRPLFYFLAYRIIKKFRAKDLILKK